uniref:Uncharacterized protein n=1 Tax=Romanomermis culicivorax TaxID=13658 RepID=A0A915INC0_ROMCU
MMLECESFAPKIVDNFLFVFTDSSDFSFATFSADLSDQVKVRLPKLRPPRRSFQNEWSIISITIFLLNLSLDGRLLSSDIILLYVARLAQLKARLLCMQKVDGLRPSPRNIKLQNFFPTQIADIQVRDEHYQTLLFDMMFTAGKMGAIAYFLQLPPACLAPAAAFLFGGMWI